MLKLMNVLFIIRKKVDHTFKATMNLDIVTYPIWERYTILSCEINKLTIRERRQIFQLARATTELSPDLLFPHYGFTLAEFAVWYTLGDSRRKTRRKRSKQNLEY